MPKIIIQITGLSRNLDWDDRMREPYWAQHGTETLRVITDRAHCHLILKKE